MFIVELNSLWFLTGQTGHCIWHTSYVSVGHFISLYNFSETVSEELKLKLGF